VIVWLAFVAMMLPHAIAYAYEDIGGGEADYADYTPPLRAPVSIDIQESDRQIAFLILFRVHPDFPGEFVYAEKTVTISGSPGASVPPFYWYPRDPTSYEVTSDVVRLTKPSSWASYCIRVHAEYHYQGRVIPVDPPVECWSGSLPQPIYLNESTYQAYEPSFGYGSCMFTGGWGLEFPYMMCSPEVSF